MAPDWKYKNHPADRSLKEDLSIDTTFDPSYISWDTPFKEWNELKDPLTCTVPEVLCFGLFRQVGGLPQHLQDHEEAHLLHLQHVQERLSYSISCTFQWFLLSSPL